MLFLCATSELTVAMLMHNVKWTRLLSSHPPHFILSIPLKQHLLLLCLNTAVKNYFTRSPSFSFFSQLHHQNQKHAYNVQSTPVLHSHGCVYAYPSKERRRIPGTYLSGKCILIALCDDHTQLSSGTLGTCQTERIRSKTYAG